MGGPGKAMPRGYASSTALTLENTVWGLGFGAGLFIVNGFTPVEISCKTPLAPLYSKPSKTLLKSNEYPYLHLNGQELQRPQTLRFLTKQETNLDLGLKRDSASGFRV